MPDESVTNPANVGDSPHSADAQTPHAATERGQLYHRVQTLLDERDRARYLVEHLFQMIDPQAWRDTGGDDMQGHYEGDYHAALLAEEIRSWTEHRETAESAASVCSCGAKPDEPCRHTGGRFCKRGTATSLAGTHTESGLCPATPESVMRDDLMPSGVPTAAQDRERRVRTSSEAGSLSDTQEGRRGAPGTSAAATLYRFVVVRGKLAIEAANKAETERRG